jgi:PepSY-associated TM region
VHVSGRPDFDKVTRDQWSIGYTGDHLFENGWNLHSNYRYQYIDFKGQTIVGNGFDGTSLTTVSRYVLVDLKEAGDLSHRDIITLSTADARVLTTWHYGQNQTLGDWFLWAMHPLHFGTLWGLPIKILWALCGVALALLSITGLMMYWNRFLRKQFRS